MQQAQAQSFNFSNLTGQEVEAIMTGLNELPSKQSRAVMNKLEGQIIEQVQAQQAAQQAAMEKAAKKDRVTEAVVKTAE